MISYQKKFIRIVECWNGEDAEAKGADLKRRFQQAQPLNGMLCREFYTVLIDLTRESEALLAGTKRGTRYEIARAQTRDDLVYGCWDGNDARVFDEFCGCAEEFLGQRRQPKLDRNWLSLLAAAGGLELTHVSD
ncbi:MAG: hypothetical protein M3R68_03475, partial [Acidobacteriota bacterium]|nr:hypothetical protein [Acidobacteriota bacterium]